MSPSLVQTGLLVGGGYVLLSIVRRIFSSSPLDTIPGPPSHSFLFGTSPGNLKETHDPDGWEFQRALEEDYGGVVRIRGLLGSSSLFVSDPVALHSILNKDIDIYEEGSISLSVNMLMFGRAGIFSTLGDDHRKMRKMMVPAFSTANLRGMISHFYEVAEGVRDGLLAPQVARGAKEVEMASVFTRTSLELIGRSGLGYSFDPLTLDCPRNEYAETIKNLTSVLGGMAALMPLVPTVMKIGMPSFRRWVLNMLPSKTLHHVRDMIDLMDHTAQEILKGKKAALLSGDCESQEKMETGTDILSILLRSNLRADDSSRLTDHELLAQTSAIIFAAMDTTSSGLSRVFHVLASHPEVQEKVRAEILEATAHKEHGHLDHDGVVELPYLDSVLRETLRLYPPVSPGVMRETIVPAVLPLTTPLTTTDGRTIQSVAVPKGTTVWVAIAKANHDPAVWGPDAREFKPERWVNGRAGNKDVKMPGVWGGTMTFIGGGRSCIGFKFSQLEMKVVLCVLLRSFRFSLSDKEIKFRMGGGITGPSVDGEAAMPLLVEKV
ncbi:cytochrome P450 [Mycena rosella]|uniref:Cytochrome P450 n=1 Tax=Mycena rosella TaxID=1033263 RepID=A0AAD7M6T9_MYCRO|nr:cytochrome P450 [Mycena rosella]